MPGSDREGRCDRHRARAPECSGAVGLDVRAVLLSAALHPELVKRVVVTDQSTGRDWIDGMGVSKLVEGTRHGYGK